jgi:hypothetical protein
VLRAAGHPPKHCYSDGITGDADFLANYLPEKLYTHPGPTGAYATIAGESEEVIGEFDVTTDALAA